MKLIFSNKWVNKLLADYTYKLRQKLPVQFTLNTDEGDRHELHTLHLPNKRARRKPKKFYLYGEGAFGGFVWNTLLLINNLAPSHRAGQEPIVHATDTFEPSQVAALKQILIRKPRARKIKSNNTNTQNLPSEQ